MVRTRTRNLGNEQLSEFEIHQRKYGKRFISLLGLGIAMGVLAALLSLFTGGTPEVAEEITDTTGEIASQAGDTVQNVGDATGELASNVSDVGSDAAANIGDAAQDITAKAGELGSDAASEVGDAVSDVGNTAGEIGSNVVEGGKDAAANIGDATQNAIAAVGDAASGVGIGKAVDLLESGKWDVGRAIPLQVDNPIQFDYDSAVLTSQGKQVVGELAEEIKQLDAEQVAVKIVGHTSQTGNPETNLLLSRQRATTVATELRNLGVENNVDTEGKGYSEPMPNIPADDARQQRTEVQLIRVK